MPLVPISFHSCAQVLYNAFMDKGDSIGIWLIPSDPKISHLCYADDVIIFSETNRKDFKVIKYILEEFCEWTGLSININKSSMVFDKAVSTRKKNAMACIMGFKTSKDLNYLGVKLSSRRLLTEDYQFIINKALKMPNSWGGRMLSLAGKIIPTKTNLLSFSIFHCTNSLVPKSALEEIYKICRSFIWNKPNGKQGIHYVSWNTLCLPSKWGGRGLHSSASKVGPLKDKLAWRYLNNSDSMLYKVLYPKYGNLLDHVNTRRKGSPAWKILMDEGKALMPLLRWKVSNGEDIDVFNDTWILDKSIKKWPTFVSPLENNKCLLSNFIYNGRWNEEALNEIMGEDLVNLILQVGINNRMEKHSLELLF
ncbi:hypothetical protein KFK09_003890 [Dendrobium nobile]|uniref:Reverse transcriptase domain-containing protein n=1 Tax=Dendrobium nobile TaxID=94219 RepID=A0A8T3C495_DENNO|nr:hypothetical protein KFK09_003890 [Dendrobium nobile]